MLVLLQITPRELIVSKYADYTYSIMAILNRENCGAHVIASLNSTINEVCVVVMQNGTTSTRLYVMHPIRT